MLQKIMNGVRLGLAGRFWKAGGMRVGLGSGSGTGRILSLIGKTLSEYITDCLCSYTLRKRGLLDGTQKSCIWGF